MASWLTGLLIGGIALTAYGVGSVYGTMTMWPKEVRGDLRSGLREGYRGDGTMSEQYLSRAWETTKKLPLEKFGSQPFLKTTGIGIALAGVYENNGKLEQAYQILEQSLNLLQEGTNAASNLRRDLSPEERMRAVSIAYKLGELAQTLNKPKEEEENWLVFSVETVLNVMKAPVVAEVVLTDQDMKSQEVARGIVEELKLPSWVLKHDLAAPFEALGSFYSSTGKVSYAMPLYLQAISILIPPPPQVSSAEDQCRAAQLMGNISELILRTRNDPEAIVQAESWATKGLEVASRGRKSTLVKHPSCEVAYACMLYNLAMIRDMAGDSHSARQLFVSVTVCERVCNAKVRLLLVCAPIRVQAEKFLKAKVTVRGEVGDEG
ncbi:hypothetical protein EST38_g12084 [Candolleomyces aberdarensis]|uniref:Uncharacterized protein n=1 Tax=Candolleomyces aberdarensis TaxID=2316362 RepID=A0A4Q2D5J3_9AGAR|nr:hypothetical protein EST38_g12084 [Candolleomyces aberdarensis]